MSKQASLLILFFVCLTGAILAFVQANQPIRTERLSKKISLNLEILLEDVDAEAKNVMKVWRVTKNLPATATHYIVLKHDSVVAWNSHHFIPPVQAMLKHFDLQFYKTGAGEFLLKKWEMKDGSLVAVIPLHVQYRVTNSYLTPFWNTSIFPRQDVQLLEPFESVGVPVELNQQIIFRVEVAEKSQVSEGFWGSAVIVFGSLSLVILMILFTMKGKRFSENYPALSFLILAMFVFVLRIGMIAIEFPARFTNSPIFDAENFASSNLNPSLGDLFLNSLAVLILCLYLFLNYYRIKLFKGALAGGPVGFIFCTVSAALILFGFLFPFVVIQTIYNNSTITLSIAKSIHFDSLRVLGLLTVVISWISTFFFAHIFLRLLACERRILTVILSFLLGCIVFISINVQTGQHYFWSFLFGVSYLVSILSLTLYNSLRKFQYKTFAYFFVTMLFLGLNGMFAVRHFEYIGDLRNQVRFANTFLDERDYFGEFLLHEASQKIASDAFVQTRMATLFFGKEAIVQKVKQIYLPGYFNRYTIGVSLFDASGKQLEGSDSTTFLTLIGRYDQDAFRTSYKGVYYISNEREDFIRKYVVPISLIRGEVKVGYIVIELILKRVIPENVFPELLIDNRMQKDLAMQTLSYAVAVGKEIQYSSGEFNYESFIQHHLENPELYTTGIDDEGYTHIAVKDMNGKISVVSSPTTPLIYWLADFSFQIVLGMAVILILLFVQGTYNYLRSRKLYLAARIQLILNLAFFLPLIMVSVITLNLTTQSSQEQLNTEFLNRASRFGEVVASTMQEHPDKNDFERAFSSLTTLANLDANIFYPSGKLMATSQPLIFESSLLSPYIKASAFKRIQHGDKIFVSTERVGKLQFYVAYTALVLPSTGKHLGILAVPFFQSASSLEKMQITILANILSIFTLVFILLLMVSHLVTKWLTTPLREITKTVGRISLTNTNQPMEWHADDEIGLMAKEYNQMLLKLNSSKQELERNQRETAWREIAQQVAHEIKNPLTPMKLTLQQLERSLEVEKQDGKLSKAVESLLSQVNSLNDIASSFSSFAKMPEPKMTEVELIGLLNKTINLHSQDGKIEFITTFEKAFVNADSQLLGRIFSNIILNGLQAVRSGEIPVIRIQLEFQDSQYRISFSDNGRGIDPQLVDKIFVPHFTTKQTGSGLGLAISKQGIEQMGGKIWFETSHRGTTFLILLPRVI